MTYQDAITFGRAFRERFPNASDERVRRVAYAFAKAWATDPRSDTHLATAFLAGAGR